MEGNLPWQTGNFWDGTLYLVNVEYICRNISGSQKKRIDATSDYDPVTNTFDDFIRWTLSKEHNIEELLDSGIKPEDIWPIRLVHFLDGKYMAEDGITRLKVFRKRGIESIYARMYHGD